MTLNFSYFETFISIVSVGTCTCFLLLCGVCNGRRDDWILFLSSVPDGGDGVLKNNAGEKKRRTRKKKVSKLCVSSREMLRLFDLNDDGISPASVATAATP